MKISYYGHSAFMVEGSIKLLFDPFLKDNPVSPVSPDDVDPDYILVSHGHSDHLGDTLYISAKTGAPVMRGTVRHFQRKRPCGIVPAAR